MAKRLLIGDRTYLLRKDDDVPALVEQVQAAIAEQRAFTCEVLDIDGNILRIVLSGGQLDLVIFDTGLDERGWPSDDLPPPPA